MKIIDTIKKIFGREEKKVASEAMEEVKELMEQGTEVGVFEESNGKWSIKFFI